MLPVPSPTDLIVPSKARLIELLREHSVRRGEFILSSGERSSLYVDCRTTTMHAEGQFVVGHLAWELIDASGLDPDAVGGLTMGADPVAYAIAYTSWLAGKPTHAFSVRKAPKEHGTGKRIEGVFREGSRVVVVEDVLTTGRSALDACEAVARHGGEILAVLAVLDREEGGRQAVEEAGHHLLSLVRASEVVESDDAPPSAQGSGPDRTG